MTCRKIEVIEEGEKDARVCVFVFVFVRKIVREKYRERKTGERYLIEIL